MCKKVAGEMLALLETCDLWSIARATFHRHADAGNCDGVMRAYRGFLERRPDVGRSIAAAGLKPIETVQSELEALHSRHPEP